MAAHDEKQSTAVKKTTKAKTNNSRSASKPQVRLIQSSMPQNDDLKLTSTSTKESKKRGTSSQKKVRRRIRRMKNGAPTEVFEEATKDWYTLSPCQLSPDVSGSGKRERFSERARRLKGVPVPDNSEKLAYAKSSSRSYPLRRTSSSPGSRNRIFIRHPSEPMLPKSDDEGDDLLLEDSSHFVTPSPSPRGVLRRSSSSPRLLSPGSDQAHEPCVQRFYSKLNLLVSDISEGSTQKEDLKESPLVSDSESDREEKKEEVDIREILFEAKKGDTKKMRKKTKSSSSSKRSSTKKEPSCNNKPRTKKARERSESPRHVRYFL